MVYGYVVAAGWLLSVTNGSQYSVYPRVPVLAFKHESCFPCGPSIVKGSEDMFIVDKERGVPQPHHSKPTEWEVRQAHVLRHA